MYQEITNSTLAIGALFGYIICRKKKKNNLKLKFIVGKEEENTYRKRSPLEFFTKKC